MIKPIINEIMIDILFKNQNPYTIPEALGSLMSSPLRSRFSLTPPGCSTLQAPIQ